MNTFFLKWLFLESWALKLFLYWIWTKHNLELAGLTPQQQELRSLRSKPCIYTSRYLGVCLRSSFNTHLLLSLPFCTCKTKLQKVVKFPQPQHIYVPFFSPHEIPPLHFFPACPNKSVLLSFTVFCAPKMHGFVYDSFCL